MLITFLTNASIEKNQFFRQKIIHNRNSFEKSKLRRELCQDQHSFKVKTLQNCIRDITLLTSEIPGLVVIGRQEDIHDQEVASSNPSTRYQTDILHIYCYLHLYLVYWFKNCSLISQMVLEVTEKNGHIGQIIPTCKWISYRRFKIALILFSRI